FVGSFGSIGVLTEVRFRVTPKPEQTATVRAEFDAYASAVGAARRICQSPPYWSAVIVTGGGGQQCAVTCLIEGFQEEVARAERELTSLGLWPASVHGPKWLPAEPDG